MILLIQGVLAQSINKEKLDSLFDAISINNKGMGSIAISKNGNMLYSRAIGYLPCTHISFELTISI
jgi:D-alanyl-D-alanine carboxypeptidase